MTRSKITELTLKRVSTADQVAELLRRRIVSGELAPGTPLREVDLSEAIGISRNTMREVIRELVHQGLVRHAAHRGATVTALDELDLDSIFRARHILEVAAIDAIAGRGKEAVRSLSPLLLRLDRALRSGDELARVEIDMDFHSALVDFLGSDRLSDFHRKLLRELRLGLALVDHRSLNKETFVRDHRRLVQLLGQEQTAKARRWIADHLSAAEQTLRSFVTSSDSRKGG